MSSNATKSTRPPLERFWQIEHILRSGRTESGDPPNCAAIARELDVNPKTIQRDLDFMRDRFSAPIEYDPDLKGWKYTRNGYVSPISNLSETELFALVSGWRVLERIGAMPLGREVSHLAEWAARARTEQTLTELAASISFVEGPGVIVNPAVLGTLTQSLTSRRRVRMTYYTLYRDRTGERDVDPYHLGRYLGEWFLIGHDHFRGEVRVFSLARIRDIRLLNDRFKVPPDFRPETYLSEEGFNFERRKEPVTVELLFDPKAGHIAQELVWHPSQRFEKRADGKVKLAFESKNLQQVLRWVMARGPDVEVLAPDELRWAVVRCLDETRRLYADDPAKLLDKEVTHVPTGGSSDRSSEAPDPEGGGRQAGRRDPARRGDGTRASR